MATLTFTINLPAGAVLTRIRVDESLIEGNELDEIVASSPGNSITGTISFIAIVNTVSISVAGVGTPNQQGDINFSYNGIPLFQTDQIFTIEDNGRFDFYAASIELT